MSGIGKTLIVLGGLLALTGVILLFLPRVPFLGRLPGDLRIERGPFTFYFPVTTSLVVSAVLSLIFWFLRRK